MPKVFKSSSQFVLTKTGARSSLVALAVYVDLRKEKRKKTIGDFYLLLLIKPVRSCDSHVIEVCSWRMLYMMC